jgi:transposase
MDTIGSRASGRARIGIVETARRTRRSWSEEEKRRIVEETLLPGASVATVAQRHAINANLLFSWRRQTALDGGTSRSVTSAPEPAEFVPIGVFDRAADGGPAMVTVPAADPLRVARSRPAGRAPKLDERPGVIEIDLADGVRVRVDAFVNERALRRVLRALKDGG